MMNVNASVDAFDRMFGVFGYRSDSMAPGA